LQTHGEVLYFYNLPKSFEHRYQTLSLPLSWTKGWVVLKKFGVISMSVCLVRE
jgi:hypothetical protein